jgi:hypothetical protein
MPQYNPMTFRFVRRRMPEGIAEPDPELDDLLVVQKLGENTLRVTYTERTQDGVLRDTTVMTYQRFFHYLWRLLWLLTIDVDPFQNVQLMIPSFPIVLVPVPTLQHHMVQIMDIVMTTCWQWPVVARVGVVSVAPGRLDASSAAIAAALRAIASSRTEPTTTPESND